VIRGLFELTQSSVALQTDNSLVAEKQLTFTSRQKLIIAGKSEELFLFPELKWNK